MYKVPVYNEFHIRSLLLKDDIDFNNFYKEQLIDFLNVSRKDTEKYKKEAENFKNIINELEKLLEEERTRKKYAHDVERFTAYDYILKRLQELKEGEKSEKN